MMAVNTFDVGSSYLMVSKKHLSRLILPYEIILDSLCYEINGNTLADANVVSQLFAQETVSDDLIILELASTKKNKAYSFTQLKKLWFSSNETLKTFVNRSYANFDVKQLNCEVANVDATLQQNDEIKITKPEALSEKSELIKNDGTLALVYEELSSSRLESLQNILQQVESPKSLIDYLFISNNKAETELEIGVKTIFAQLCLDNSLDLGWNHRLIFEKLCDSLKQSIKKDRTFTIWYEKTSKLLTGGAVNIPFDDNGLSVLRAVTLVLLNPEIENLEAIKAHLGDKIGDTVFQIAKAYVLLRSGYSLFNSDERGKLSQKSRILLQDINAALYNEDFSLFSRKTDPEIQSISTTGDPSFPEFLLSEISYLSVSTETLDDYHVYDINGLTPNAGFFAKLIENKQSKQLYFWLIDTRINEGKCKGKIISLLVDIQLNLPEDFRFEKREIGACFRLSTESYNNVDKLKFDINLVSEQLASLKVINAKRCKI